MFPGCEISLALIERGEAELAIVSARLRKRVIPTSFQYVVVYVKRGLMVPKSWWLPQHLFWPPARILPTKP